MKNNFPIKTAKTGYIVMSVLFMFFGLFMIIKPMIFGAFAGSVIGVMLLVFGVIKLIGYFSKDLFRLAFQYDFAFGILLILLGLIVVIKPNNLINFICMVIGIAVLADGLFRIQMSMDAKAFGIKKWWLILTASIIAGCIGLALIFSPEAGSAVLIRILGIALAFEGVMNLITVLTSVKIINHQKPDVLDIEYRELD